MPPQPFFQSINLTFRESFSEHCRLCARAARTLALAVDSPADGGLPRLGCEWEAGMGQMTRLMTVVCCEAYQAFRVLMDSRSPLSRGQAPRE